MIASSIKISRFLKIGTVLFCFMCLFFATYMASRYEHQKTETEIQTYKVKELEDKIRELSAANQELLHIRSALAQAKERMAKEIDALREKYLEFEGWGHAVEKETLKGDLATNQESGDTDDVKKKLPDGGEEVTSRDLPLMVEKGNSTFTQPDTIMPSKRLEGSPEESNSK
ncbi:MAG: hypothetical protein E3K36_15560 [Candidatus Brocadia sp.]|nr:hypothetical protein [Candidatus Brocadia sp.]